METETIRVSKRARRKIKILAAEQDSTIIAIVDSLLFKH